MVAQSWCEWGIRDTAITERAVLRAERVSTGVNAQGVCEGWRSSYTLVADFSVLSRHSVAAGLDAQGFCNWRISSTSVACLTKLTYDGVAACLNALCITELSAFLCKAEEDHSNYAKKYRLAHSHLLYKSLQHTLYIKKHGWIEVQYNRA